MKTGITIAILVFIAAIGLFAFYMIDIDVTEPARLPDVDVSVEGGNLPEIEAKTGDIDIGTDEVTVEVPTVDIKPAPAD